MNDNCIAARLLLVAFFILLFTEFSFSADSTLLFDPDTGYRVGRYRSPTPETVAGGTRINNEMLQQLVNDQKTILIDVMAADGAGPDPIDGQWLVSKPRNNIPGSVWLPDVGRGTLDDVMSHYFREQLLDLTAADKSLALVFYCVADCWMSWNATRRAAQWGYTNVFWYAEGTDGWIENDLPLAPAIPVPVPILE